MLHLPSFLSSPFINKGSTIVLVLVSAIVIVIVVVVLPFFPTVWFLFRGP